MMSEQRTILGYITHPIEGKREIAFPEVRAWIKSRGEVVVHPGVDSFPQTGTVFFHASAANETLPLPDHFGFFECRVSQRPGGTAAWEVFETHDSLCQVLRLRSPITRPMDLYREIEAFECRDIAKVILGSGRIYVLSSDEWMIGPFTVKDEHLAATDRMMRWKQEDVALIDSGDKGYLFTCFHLLGSGLNFPPTLQDAIKRVLKLISKKGRCEFLSRLRISELATELGDSDFAEDYSWLLGDLGEMLPHLRDTLDVSKDATAMMLASPEIASLLEAHWRSSHVEKIEGEESKLKKKSEALARTTERHDALEKSLAHLRQEEAKLDKSVGAKRLAAQNAFNDEISRLASDPSQFAIFSSLFSRNQPPAQSSLPSTAWRKISNSRRKNEGKENSLGEVANELVAMSVSPRCAYEIAAVATAAFMVGQVLSIRSPLAPILADAILFGGGHEFYWSLEVPAGLLDPLPPPAEEAGSLKIALLFNGANRSDYNLVIANFRNELLKQLFRNTHPIDAILTLDSVDGLTVDQPLPIGPCISGEFVHFSDRPAGMDKMAKQFTLKTVEAVSPMEKDDFESLFTAKIDRLKAMKDPFMLLMARRFCGSLKAMGTAEGRVKELFIKYWLLPRLKRDELASLLGNEPPLGESDAQLKSYLEKISE